MNMHYGKILGVGSGKQANFVTSAVYDVHTRQPEFKYSAVSLINVSSEHKEDHSLSKPLIEGETGAILKTVKFFEDLINICPVGIMITDSAQNIIMINDAACSIFDVSSKEVIETNLFIWLEQFGPDSIRNWTELEKDVYRKGYCHNVEFQKRSAPDVRRYFSVNASRSKQMIISDTGGIISIWHDITDRKNADEEQYKSQQMLKLVMDTIPQSIFWKDRSSVYLGCNENFIKSTCIAETNDIVGKTDYDIFWNNEVADSYRRSDNRIMETEKPEYHIIESRLRDNGKLMWVDKSKMPLCNVEGKVVGVLGTYEDITERMLLENELKNSEKDKRQLLESLKECVYQCEPGVEGVFTWINKSGADMFGYKSPEEMIGVKVRDIYANPDDRRKLVEKLERDGAWMNFTSLCKKKNGESFYTERTSHMIKNEEGESVRIEGIIRDITERKRQETKLQREIEELKKKQKAKTKKLGLKGIRITLNMATPALVSLDMFQWQFPLGAAHGFGHFAVDIQNRA